MIENESWFNFGVNLPQVYSQLCKLGQFAKSQDPVFSLVYWGYEKSLCPRIVTRINEIMCGKQNNI